MQGYEYDDGGKEGRTVERRIGKGGGTNAGGEWGKDGYEQREYFFSYREESRVACIRRVAQSFVLAQSKERNAG